MNRLMTSLFVFASLLLANIAHAQVSLQTAKISIPSMKRQQTRLWCWASCIQNCLEYYDIRVSQSEVVEATFGSAISSASGDPKNILKNLFKASALVPDGMVAAAMGVAFPEARIVLKEIEIEKSPMIISIKTGPSSGHALVWYGVEYLGDRQNPNIVFLLVQDPIDGLQHRISVEQLRGRWDNTFYLRRATPYPHSFILGGDTYTGHSDLSVEKDGTVFNGHLWYFNKDKKWHLWSPRTNKDYGQVE